MTDLAPPRTLLGWLFPPAAILAAFGLHWAINVPPGPLPPPGQKEEPKKPEPKDKDKDKKGRDAADKEPAEPLIPFTTPRSPGLLTQTWAAYDDVDFAKEPTFEAWSAAHRPLISQVVAAARTHTFKGRTPLPSVSTSSVECHTMRCSFVLTTAEKADLELMLETLDGLLLGGATIWHRFLPDPVELEPSKRKGATPRNRVKVIASFIRDLPPLDAVTLADGKTPLRSSSASAPEPAPGPAPAPPSGSPSAPPSVPKSIPSNTTQRG